MVIIPLKLRLTMMYGQSIVIFGLFIFVAVELLNRTRSNLRHLTIVEGIQFNAFLPVM